MKRKNEDECTGTVDVQVETRSQKLTRLANEAGDLDNEIQYAEWKLDDVVAKIKAMNPTKGEIKSRDLQDILDCYGV